MLTEAAVMQQIQLAAPALGVTLWRNNVGAARDSTGRHIRYGLGNVSASLTRKITSVDLVGMIHETGRIVAIECKRQGWKYTNNERERAQKAFIELVKSRGGCGGFCQSVDDFRKVIQNVKSR